MADTLETPKLQQHDASMDLQELMAAFENDLQQAVQLPENSRVAKAMEYSLMAGGKRIRPRLLFALLQDYGLDPQAGIPAAAALEMIHTYSLIHDDLPAMDNDILRRGRATCHIAFDEPTAILAGDGLLTHAFAKVLESNTSAENKVQLVDALSHMAGPQGMIYGQELDIAADGKSGGAESLEELEAIEKYKTGCLLTLPLAMASILAERPEDQPALQRIGRRLGLEFQIQDDILDVTKSAEELGKSNSDENNDKMTAIKVLGLDGARQMVDKLHHEILADLDQMNLQGDNVRQIILELYNRQK